jgi:hypothetical protein
MHFQKFIVLNSLVNEVGSIVSFPNISNLPTYITVGMI